MKTSLYIITALIVLFIGITVGSKTTREKDLREFEKLRHQALASEIDLQTSIINLMIAGKNSDAQRTVTKWLEQNVCEQGAYKHGKFFMPDREILTSIHNAKKLVEEKQLVIGACSKKTFAEYSSLNK